MEQPRDTKGRFGSVERTETCLKLERDYEVDEETIDTFTGGDCWRLAKELHERTGWPVLVVGDGKGNWVHMGVRGPEGDFIDVYGASTDAQETSEFAWNNPDFGVHELDQDEADAIFSSESARPGYDTSAEAQEVADSILRAIL